MMANDRTRRERRRLGGWSGLGGSEAGFGARGRDWRGRRGGASARGGAGCSGCPGQCSSRPGSRPKAPPPPPTLRTKHLGDAYVRREAGPGVAFGPDTYGCRRPGALRAAAEGVAHGLEVHFSPGPPSPRRYGWISASQALMSTAPARRCRFGELRTWTMAGAGAIARSRVRNMSRSAPDQPPRSHLARAGCLLVSMARGQGPCTGGRAATSRRRGRLSAAPARERGRRRHCSPPPRLRRRA